MKTFRELGLSDDFTSVLEQSKITIPSEIQEKTIPLVLAGKDIIGGSATGSGKTLAFASGIVENLEKNGRVQALILTPTRELAEQIANTIARFSRHRKLNVLAVYGGISIDNQIRSLRNADIVVGTPGRILDHLNRETLNLGRVKFLVLDEVDRMFDMGFQVDVEKILEECPKKRQTMLFSATITAEIDYLAKKYTKNPVEISVESYLDESKLHQIYYDVPNNLKFSLLVHLLEKENAKLVIIFCNTRKNADFVAHNLNNLKMNVKAIHGGLNQNRRNRVLGEFNSKRGTNILICTDVAARGLDIQGISHIYNYDLPKTSVEYIHRIGRTARAGKEGIAINLLSSRDYENFRNISRDEKLKIEKKELPLIKRVNIVMEPESRRESRSFSHKRSFGSRQRNNVRNKYSGERGRENKRIMGEKSPNRNRLNNFRRNNQKTRQNSRYRRNN